MTRTRFALLAVPTLGVHAATALAQSNIIPTDRFSWSENVGWINWHDAGSPAGAQGVFVGPAVLSGFAWGENIGWINFGDGSPSSGVHYANVNGTDFGVNVNSDDTLSGYAWGENIGWVNFDGGALAMPPNPARIDTANGRLRGFAWGENIGWINLDDATHFVGVTCPSDFNQDGFVSGEDFDAYLVEFEEGDADADFDRDGFVTGEDFEGYVTAFEVGC